MENTIKHQQNLLRKLYTAWVDCQTGLQTQEEGKEMHAFYHYLNDLITPKETGINEDSDLVFKKGFKDIVSFLIRNLEPEKIFLLPKYSDNEKSHLLLIIPDDDERPFEELIRLQEHAYLKRQKIALQLLKASAFENTSSIYFTVTCNKESLLYDNGYFALSEMTEESYMNIKVAASECFCNGLEKMQTFLEDAKIYEEDNPPMAAFHLYHAVEIILDSLLKSITGETRPTQRFRKELQPNLGFIPEILKIMGNWSKKDDQLLDLLETAYSGYCHSNNYTITVEELDTLFTWVSQLYNEAETTFTDWSAKFDRRFLNLAEHE